MVRVIYGDVLLLVDFCMDFLILYLTGLFIRRRTKTMCIIFSALLGGIYSVAEVFINGNDFLDFLIGISVGMLMCYISFGGFKFIKTVVVFFSISAIFGGIMCAIFFMLGSYHFDLFGNMRGYAYTHIPLWLFVLLALISFAVSWMLSYIGRERLEKKDADCEIFRNGKNAKIKVIFDSGNFVKEPISGKSVIIVKASALKGLFDASEYEAISKNDAENLLKNRFRMISAFGIDGEKRIYYAFLPDRILIKDRKINKECDAYVAIIEHDGVLGEYAGIVNPAIVA